MQFRFMPERRTVHAVLNWRRLHEEHHVKGNSCISVFVDGFDRVPKIALEWAMDGLEWINRYFD